MALTIKTTPDFVTGAKIGDSIAVNGCCLTAEELTPNSFTVTMMPQSFNKTIFKDSQVGDQVNVERALAAGGRFEGHIVTGHIDDTIQLLKKKVNENALELTFDRPKRLKKQLISQGSVALNGVSLTIMQAKKGKFSVGLIPHTQDETNLSKLETGDYVNLETDVIGKYVEANLK
jgi:riboflavin synthase